MPCRQVQTYNGATGSGKSGGGGYATEAECLQACREGACCDGTTCSVKPACQCVDSTQKFMGIGTRCVSDTCQLCTPQGYPKVNDVDRCYCYCTVNGGTIPRFVNITFEWSYSSTYTPFQGTPTQPQQCNRSGAITATLALKSSSVYSGCFAYELKTSDYWLQASFGVTNEGNQEYGSVLGTIRVCGTGLAAPNDTINATAGIDQKFVNALTSDTGLGAGMCFSRYAGVSQSSATPEGVNICDALPGWSCRQTSRVVINGFQ